MEQLNSNIERVIEANSTIEVFNTGAFYALVRAYKYVVVDNKPVKEKINVPFSFDLYNKDNDKISTGTISPGEKATFKVPTYKMVINNTYDYEVHIVYSFGSGTVSQLKTDLELNTEDLADLTKYDKLNYEILKAQTAIDKTPVLLQKFPIFIPLDAIANTYFNVIGLAAYKKGSPVRNQKHFITHIDISFDYSQAHTTAGQLYVTNTFNPAMSFGQYNQLKTLEPETIATWNARKWTARADNHLPTRSKSLIQINGQIVDDGHFRVEINEAYGFGDFIIDNFILKTDIVHNNKPGIGPRIVAIRTYTNTYLETPAHPLEKVLTGTYDFKKYNRCTNQKPIRTVDSNMLVVDATVYGYLLPD